MKMEHVSSHVAWVELPTLQNQITDTPIKIELIDPGILGPLSQISLCIVNLKVDSITH